MTRIPALFLLLMAACRPEVTPQTLVDRAIAWQGGEVLNKAEVNFDFRGRHFRITRDDGMFEYERTYVDTSGATFREVLSNSGLIREVNGERVPLEPRVYASVETAVNSVVYFALLPLPLNDPGATKRLLGESVIDGVEYDQLEVTFVPEGGGRDYDDRFVYWFNRETGSLDYMAYFYHTNEGGSRFRKAVAFHELEGVRLADYLNFRADDLGLETIEQYGERFDSGSLTLVSEIFLENVTVRPL
jgi:uncharacterized protein DUF6503